MDDRRGTTKEPAEAGVSDDQPDVPDSYADVVDAMTDTNNGTVKPSRREPVPKAGNGREGT